MYVGDFQVLRGLAQILLKDREQLLNPLIPSVGFPEYLVDYSLLKWIGRVCDESS
jgi:hypothetical protein